MHYNTENLIWSLLTVKRTLQVVFSLFISTYEYIIGEMLTANGFQQMYV